jgi:hydroxymethylglutaryl-CoA reductase (NADPH)
MKKVSKKENESLSIKDLDTIKFNSGIEVVSSAHSKIPKYGKDDYDSKSVAKRLDWLESTTQKELPHLGGEPTDSTKWKGNIENLVGTVQVPVGIAGPIKISGKHAEGDFLVPFATTEGAVVRTYGFGMRLISKSGGVHVHSEDNGVHITPVFFCKNIKDCLSLKSWIQSNEEDVKKWANSTTNHGKLLELKYFVRERRLLVQFIFHTGDAMGLNMVNVAAHKACTEIAKRTNKTFHCRSNYSADKKPSAHSANESFGKSVFAEAVISRKVLNSYARLEPEDIIRVWNTGMMSCSKAQMIGMNSQAANAVAAIFLATGQDIAELPTSSLANIACELDENKDLYVGLHLPSLLVGTVGGGTGVGSQKECLEIMDCYGSGKAMKLSEIIASTVLCGEIATFCGVANDTFVSTHDKMGRNRM